MENDHVRTSSGRWLDFTVWTAALWASLLNLLNFNHYPLLRPEVAIVLLGLALIGILMGALQRVARPRLAFLVAAFFAAIMIDLNSSIGLHWFYVAWAALAVVGFFALEALLKISLAASLGVLFFQLAGSMTGMDTPVLERNEARNLQSADSGNVDRPAIVHLVLDSYLGLDGMGLGPQEYLDLRREQAAFLADRGFLAYPRAYSRHARTMNSLPYLFSYGSNPPIVHAVAHDYAVPEELPYFTDLDSRGYRVSAVLPAYFDLCVNQKLTHCRTYESSAPTSMLETEATPLDRAKVLGFSLLRLAHLPMRTVLLLQIGANDLLGREDRLPFNRSELFPLASLSEFDRFANSLSDLEPGEARFAHFLLPHDPYMLNPDCSLKPEARWLDEHGPGAPAAREKSYADQVRCLQRRLARMMDVLDQTPAGRQAIVLIHGDHGSRIAPRQPSLDAPELTPREMLMTHSTFFAMRVPGGETGMVPEAHALDELMAEFREKDFAAAPFPEERPPRVLVMDTKWVPREWRALPDFTP